MKKITAVTLLYAVTAMPAFAAGDNTAPKPDALGTPSNITLNGFVLNNITLSEIRAKVDRLSTLNLLESDSNFSLFGKLSIPRLTTADEAGMSRDAVTYGLHGQFGGMPGMGIPKMGVRFGWSRYLAGQNNGENLYSLTAVVNF